MIRIETNITSASRYETPVRCPKCKRVLGDVKDVQGEVSMIYRCHKCGCDVDVRAEGKHSGVEQR